MTSSSHGSPAESGPSVGSPSTAAVGAPGQGQAAGTPGPATNPDDFSDALVSAGVDLRQEEQLLSSSIPIRAQTFPAVGRAGLTSGYFDNNGSYFGDEAFITPEETLQRHRRAPFLDLHAATAGDGKDNDALTLISLACQEWLSDILTAVMITSAYRRDSGARTITNPSDVAKALRQIAIKDKEREEKYQQAKLSLEHSHGVSGNSESGAGDGKPGGSEKNSHATEEVLHRQTNATAALMMAGGRSKKYSWMMGSGGGAASPAAPTPGSISRRESGAGGHGIRIREAREEQSVVMRDLLSVLEYERVGVEKAVAKGWAKIRD
ncbi:transcription initiation factor TFIID component TAF4 [Limtongia smithiae]|uniref:transcription initiation factor TFIID component TAF4 n=1 Tax=Limtongia smithiae TaxID=1125753 RepID=UPI0034CD226B